LEKEVKERAKKDSQKEQQDAEAPIINPGGFGNRLLLTQGNGYALENDGFIHDQTPFSFSFPGQAPPIPNGTGIIVPVRHVSSMANDRSLIHLHRLWQDSFSPLFTCMDNLQAFFYTRSIYHFDAVSRCRSYFSLLKFKESNYYKSGEDNVPVLIVFHWISMIEAIVMLEVCASVEVRV
jgi:hypothetical protein